MPFRAETVGITILKIVAYNPRRRSLVILNNSTSTLTISQDPSNVSTEGFPLGESDVAILTRKDGDEPELALYAISTIVGNDVRIVEGFGLLAQLEEATSPA